MKKAYLSPQSLVISFAVDSLCAQIGGLISTSSPGSDQGTFYAPAR
ncbi:MAG: hypothetical protein MJZ48_01100 [Paludibacteraceae bacterium]|nr:hypothetical protein [Paludibacteraceae bacterium]